MSSPVFLETIKKIQWNHDNSNTSNSKFLIVQSDFEIPVKHIYMYIIQSLNNSGVVG